MVPAVGIEAVIERTRQDGSSYFTTRRVLWWNDEGDGFVLDNHGLPVNAHWLTGFVRYQDVGSVHIVPATPGTMAAVKDEGRLPVVAWMIDGAEGSGRAIILSGDMVNVESGNEVTSYHHPDL